MPGISEPTYTPEEIEEFNRKENEPVEYNGKTYTKYEATQRQRKLETTMRAQRQEIKLLKEGGANEDDLIAARSRYRGTSAEYARFSKAIDLPQQRERVTVDGLGNIGQGKYTQTDSVNNKSVDNGAKGDIIKSGYSESVPEDFIYLNKADNNFERFSDKELSDEILSAIENTISLRNNEKSDFDFDSILIAKFDEKFAKSVFITDLEEKGSKLQTKLYINKDFVIGKSKNELDSMCRALKESGWWKSECLEDLVNHEIFHARIGYINGSYKSKQMYDLLVEDDRVKGFCRLVDNQPSEFMNEMYVAIKRGDIIDEKYLSVYNEYAKDYLGGVIDG